MANPDGMPVVEAKRTLVKSPPELWAELSDSVALARHLEDFGEIRIVRVEGEKLVEWEGDLAKGRVELDASGWGTKVTLTVETPDPEPESVAGDPEPEPVAVQPEPEPEPEQEPVAAQEPEPARRIGWWARLFAKRRKRPELAAPAVEREPAPQPEAVVVPEPETEPVVVAAAASEAEQPAEEPAQPELDPERILQDVLAALGSAHHRPFSRI
jgi:hypothetical protein